LAGANLIYGLGMLEMGITFSFGQLLIDSEIARMIKFTLNGVAVNDRTLALDAIHEVGVAGHFLNHETTFRHMRSQSKPELIDRSIRQEWSAGGSSDMYERACDKAKFILETHQPDPLPEEVQNHLAEIIQKAENDCGVTDSGMQSSKI
jgi:trimethylamine--corrinoid protein Co-methyltransferase